MKKLLLYTILVTALIKIIAVFFLSDHCKLWEDYFMAQNLYDFGELKYFHNSQWNYNYNFPVYPFCLNLLFYVFGKTVIPALILNILLHSVSTWLFYWVVIYFSNRFNHLVWIDKNKFKIAFLSALGFLFHPLINYYVLINAHPFVMNQFFIVGSLFFMFRYLENQYTSRMILYACFLGLGFIDRSTLCAVTLPFVILIYKSNPLLISVKKIALVAFIALLPVFLWMFRNYSITGKIELTSSLGENMWLGILEETEGTTMLPNGSSYYQLLGNDLNKIPNLSSAQQNEYYLKMYDSVLINYPKQVIKMFFIKLKNFWFFRSDLGVDYSQTIQKIIPMYKVIYLTVFFMAILVSFVIGKRVLLFWSFLIALSVLQAIVYVETRHRILIEPFLVFLAVMASFYLHSVYQKKSLRFKTK